MSNTTMNTTTSDGDEDEDEGIPQIVVHQVIYLSVISIVAIFANLVVLVKSVQYERSLKHHPGIAMNTTNFLVISLAISDLGTSTFSTAVFIFPYYVPRFPITVFTCTYIQPLRELFFAVSIFCVALIAVGRYLILLKAFRKRLSFFSSCLVNNAILWIVCYLIFALPFSAVYKVDYVDGASTCNAYWDSPIGQRVHLTFIVVANVFIPTLMVCLSYVGIIRRLRRAQMTVVPEEITDKLEGNTTTSLAVQSHRIVKVSFLLLIVFFVTYVPYAVLIMAIEYGNLDASTNFPGLEMLHAIATCLLYSGTMMDPLIIIFTSDLYRPKCFSL